jgi:hypothetical protein
MRRRIAGAALALFAAATAGGCQTVNLSALKHPGRPGDKPGDSPGYSYAAGRAVQSFDRPPTAVQPAVIAALDDLRIENLRQTNDGGVIVFEGTTADARKASVTLRPSPAGSRLSARFGLFGDEPMSRALMDRVGVRLGSLPPSGIPTDIPSEPARNPYFSRTAVPDSVMLKDQADAPFRSSPVP